MSPNLHSQVDDLNDQIQVFDRRKFSSRPVLEFGRRDTVNSKHTRSRRRKGASYGNHFVRGYEDGVVALFDYRNVKVRDLC